LIGLLAGIAFIGCLWWATTKNDN